MSAAYSLRHATDYNSKLSRPVQVNAVRKQHECQGLSHSVTCHPTRADTPRRLRLVLNLPTLEGWKVELT